MAEVIIMPKLGFNMSEGKLVKWYKKEGETVKKGENLFSIETDKTNMDIEAVGDGVVRKLLIEEGAAIPVTLPIAIVGEAGEDIDAVMAEALAKLGRDQAPGGQCAPAASAGDTEKDKTGSCGGSPENDGGKANGAYDYDIAVLGGGPGGYVAAIKAAQLGKKVAIIEKENFGGTCLNVGCIPTKSLLRSLEALKEVKECGEFGVAGLDVSRAALDLKAVQDRKRGIIAKLVGGVKGLLKGNGVTILSGEGRVADGHTIAIDGKKITAEYIILATGSKVKSLPIPISDKMEVLTSTELLDINEVPQSVAVIGGGVIGIEFAYFLAGIGAKVTVIEFLDRILPMVDEEITGQVEKNLKSMGITIHTGARVTEITEDGVCFRKDGQEQAVCASKVLMAVGREPRLDGVDCQALGIQMDRGAIAVDERLKTSVDSVYAIGDVNGKAMLAHVASMEGIVAVESICGHSSAMDYNKVPSAIYIQPEIASIGLTEKQAAEKYGAIKVGKFPMAANGKAKVEGKEGGMVKVIAEEKYGEIVGVHLYCIHATDMIAEAAAAMTLEATAEEIAMTIHPHPTVSEVMHEAMHAVGGKAIHFL